MSAVLRARPSCAAAVARTGFFRGRRMPAFERTRSGWDAIDPWQGFPFNGIPTPSSVLMRRSALQGVGGWPARFPYTGDQYLWLRLSILEPLVQPRSVTVHQRLHDASYSAEVRRRHLADFLAEAHAASEDALEHLSRSWRSCARSTMCCGRFARLPPRRSSSR
jgi:hypothetical protein